MKTCQIYELRAPVKNPGKKSVKDPWGVKAFPAGMLLSRVSGLSGEILISPGKPGLPIADERAKALLDAAGTPTKPIEPAALFELHGFDGETLDEAFTWMRGHFPNETDWLARSLGQFAQQKLAGIPDVPATVTPTQG